MAILICIVLFGRIEDERCCANREQESPHGAPNDDNGAISSPFLLICESILEELCSLHMTRRNDMHRNIICIPHMHIIANSFTTARLTLTTTTCIKRAFPRYYHSPLHCAFPIPHSVARNFLSCKETPVSEQPTLHISWQTSTSVSNEQPTLHTCKETAVSERPTLHISWETATSVSNEPPTLHICKETAVSEQPTLPIPWDTTTHTPYLQRDSRIRTTHSPYFSGNSHIRLKDLF